ncbi:MAG TPA: hypothetical protein VF817_00650 [Patescibacteria group bacterium]
MDFKSDADVALLMGEIDNMLPFIRDGRDSLNDSLIRYVREEIKDIPLKGRKRTTKRLLLQVHFGLYTAPKELEKALKNLNSAAGERSIKRLIRSIFDALHLLDVEEPKINVKIRNWIFS